MNVRFLSDREVRLLELAITERNGRQIRRLYEQSTRRRIGYGSLYMTYRRLEEAGWVTVRDEGEGEQRVRLIRTTGPGLRVLESRAESPNVAWAH